MSLPNKTARPLQASVGKVPSLNIAEFILCYGPMPQLVSITCQFDYQTATDLDAPMGRRRNGDFRGRDRGRMV
nr:MAG TPA: hypothetical protein [Caudoviricetes sp.]